MRTFDPFFVRDFTLADLKSPKTETAVIPTQTPDSLSLDDFDRIASYATMPSADKVFADLVRDKVRELNEAINAAGQVGVKVTIDPKPMYNIQTGEKTYLSVTMTVDI